MSDVPLPPPYGAPRGPRVTTAGLFERWFEGSTTGACSEGHLEGPVLVAGDHSLAIRLEGAVLIRTEVPGDVGEMRAALERFLEHEGVRLIEQDTPLGAMVGIEVTGLRGEAWDLWARDADTGHEALVRRAAPDMPGLLDDDTAQRRAEIDAALEEIERRL